MWGTLKLSNRVQVGICQFRLTKVSLEPRCDFAVLIPCIFLLDAFPVELTKKQKPKYNGLQHTKQLSPRSESIRKDPKELCNPKGRSCLNGEVLAAETLEISGSGILLSELSMKVQPQILGVLNKNYQQAVLPVCTPLKGRANVSKSCLYISQNSDSYPVKFDELPCARLPKILLTEP